MKRKGIISIVTTLCCIVLLQSAQANILFFYELPLQPVDGVDINGVTFDFKVAGTDSLDALYNSNGPGETTYIQDPSLEGDASGILTLDFDEPVDAIEFGVALLFLEPLSPGFNVELFDTSLVSMGVTPVNTQPLIEYSEGVFTYGGSLVQRVQIDFNDIADRFALDNLYFNPVPEPTTLALLGLGGLVLGRKRCYNG